MLSLIHFISATRRLKETEKTVLMLGGETEAPPMVLAQRDIIKLEVDYYKKESVRLCFYLIALAFFVLGLYNPF